MAAYKCNSTPNRTEILDKNVHKLNRISKTALTKNFKIMLKQLRRYFLIKYIQNAHSFFFHIVDIGLKWLVNKFFNQQGGHTPYSRLNYNFVNYLKLFFLFALFFIYIELRAPVNMTYRRIKLGIYPYFSIKNDVSSLF